MKTNKPDKFKLFEGGRGEFERIDEFTNKVEEIRKDLTEKYSQKLSNERNWVRRFLIKVNLEVEIRKRIRTLSSLKNLHAINH